jgi:hypothetical protein
LWSFENLDDPLHPDERTIRILLANESELIKSDYAVARETDATLYQVQLAVEFEPGCTNRSPWSASSPPIATIDISPMMRSASTAACVSADSWKPMFSRPPRFRFIFNP